MTQPGLTPATPPWMDQARAVFPLVRALLQLERGTALGLAARSELDRWAVGLLLASQAALGLGMRSWSWMFIHSAGLAVTTGGLHLLARAAGAPANFRALFRCVALLWSVNLLGLLGPLGMIVLAAGNLWCVVALMRVSEDLYEFSGAQAFQAVLVAWGGAAVTIVGLTVASSWWDLREPPTPMLSTAPPPPVVALAASASAPLSPPQTPTELEAPAPTPPATLGISERQWRTSIMGTWELDAPATLEANAGLAVQEKVRTQIIPGMRGLTVQYREDGVLVTTGSGVSSQARWKALDVVGQKLALEIHADDGVQRSELEVVNAATLRTIQDGITLVMRRSPTAAVPVPALDPVEMDGDPLGAPWGLGGQPTGSTFVNAEISPD